MKYTEKVIKLKNGADCILKSPNADNAEEILSHLKRTSAETNYMARYAEEITMTVEQERAFLDALLVNERDIMISAVINGNIVANAGICCVAPFIKYQHRAEIGISIQKSFWGLGLGSVILQEIVVYAKQAGYEQLELEVVADNNRAITLYEKFGFMVYGSREKSFKYKDATYGTEYLMLLRL